MASFQHNSDTATKKRECTHSCCRKEETANIMEGTLLDMHTGKLSNTLSSWPTQVRSLDLLLFGVGFGVFEHAGLALYDNKNRLVVFDISPDTGVCRLQPAINLMREGWMYVGLSPLHSPPREELVRAVELVAASMKGDKQTNDQANRCRAIDKLFHDAHKVIHPQAQMNQEVYWSIITPLDLAMKPGRHEYPNILAKLTE